MRSTKQVVPVWDPLVRLTHWSLAVSFGVTYCIGSDWLGLHAQIGYVIALLVLFRCIWGIWGTEHARFTGFVVGWSVLRPYLESLRKGPVEEHLGHDPLGALMIVALLLSLSITAITGMSLFGMEGRGPLAGTFVVGLPGGLIEDIHHIASDVTLALVVGHIVGVMVMGRYHRQRLIRAMFNGRKWLP